MWKRTVLALAVVGLFGACVSTEAEAGNRFTTRRPLLRAIQEANRNALNNPTFTTSTPTWGYRYQPPSYGWSFRPDTGWGFYQSGGT